MMPAGPDLDALVAERVMRWQRGEESQWLDEAGLQVYAQWRSTDDYYHPEPAWSPSTDIGAAWQVVEKLRDRGSRLTIETSDDGWVVTLYAGSPEPHALVHAFTAPHAICLAALRTLDNSPSPPVHSG